MGRNMGRNLKDELNHPKGWLETANAFGERTAWKIWGTFTSEVTFAFRMGEWMNASLPLLFLESKSFGADA